MVAAIRRFDVFEPEQSTLLQRTHRVLHVLSERIRAKRLTIELDFDLAAASSACSMRISRALEQLIELAISRSPDCSELEITVLHSERGMEIEVADCGLATPAAWDGQGAFRTQPLAELPNSPSSSTTTDLPENSKLFCRRCPQGGLAWTLVVADRAAALKVA